MNDYFIAAIWIAMALAASLISIRIGVSVALVEILVGALLGNIPGVRNYVEQTSSQVSWRPGVGAAHVPGRG